MTARNERHLAVKQRLAHFPCVKTLDQFDFDFQPGVDEKKIRELATLRFVEQAGVVLFTGPPGVGKTRLAIGLGLEAVRIGYSVYFITLSDLADQIPKDRADSRWVEKLRVLSHPRLLIIDEVGYVPLDLVVSYFVFSLVCRREGIQPSTYYAWLKDFMEAGKERLNRDTVRDATKAEVQDIKRENARLKQLVAELSLQVHVLKKRPYRVWNKGKVCPDERSRKG